jgi:hypothetical protein
MAIADYPNPPTSVPDRNDAEARDWGPGWPNCQTDKLTTIELSNGVRITVRREVANLIRDLLDYVLWRGYVIRPKVTGGYNCRAIVDSDPPVASNHSWGLAVDVNWDVNALGDDEPGEVDIPKWMVSLMWAHGWYWGGWYGREDAMHFEYVYRPSDVAGHAAAARSLLEEAMSLDPDEEALVFNGTSAVTSLALMRDTAPQRDWQGAGAGQAAAPLALPMVAAVREIKNGVAKLVESGLPVQITVDEPTQAAIAVRVAELLRPGLVEQIADELAARLAG